MLQHHGDKGSKDAHVGSLCSHSVPRGIGYSVASSLMCWRPAARLYPYASGSTLPHDSYRL